MKGKNRIPNKQNRKREVLIRVMMKISRKLFCKRLICRSLKIFIHSFSFSSYILRVLRRDTAESGRRRNPCCPAGSTGLCWPSSNTGLYMCEAVRSDYAAPTRSHIKTHCDKRLFSKSPGWFQPRTGMSPRSWCLCWTVWSVPP